MNFYELYLKGEVSLEKIDDYVTEWHNSSSSLSLQEYLGIPEQLFESWVINGNSVLQK